ncbi:hypothetical protein DRO37_00465 [Candidatus Bathyarchaeota archaeon]|nr:MAG: hypothetical protein DRO37_00465 [Candidatus Bathyarchaeota archaeon]
MGIKYFGGLDGLRRSSLMTSLIGMFAALHSILYLIPIGLWRSLSIYLEPLEGIILGPYAGFLAVLIGSIIARLIKPTGLWMFGVFAEPIGALACGLIVKGRWKTLLLIYAVMLGAYFIHPLGREIPLWTILDVLAAPVLIYPAARFSRRLPEADACQISFATSLIAFIGCVTDSLARIFLLIPAGLYIILGLPKSAVYMAFLAEASDSYIEDILTVVFAFTAGSSILLALRRIPGIRYPLS